MCSSLLDVDRYSYSPPTTDRQPHTHLRRPSIHPTQPTSPHLTSRHPAHLTSKRTTPHTQNSLVTIFREEGAAALYKGFVPKVLRLAPGGGVLLLVVEFTMDLFRKGALFFFLYALAFSFLLSSALFMFGREELVVFLLPMMLTFCLFTIIALGPPYL